MSISVLFIDLVTFFKNSTCTVHDHCCGKTNPWLLNLSFGLLLSLAKEKERQREIARERLEAKRKRAAEKKSGKTSNEMTVDQLHLEEEDRRLQEVISAANEGQGKISNVRVMLISTTGHWCFY